MYSQKYRLILQESGDDLQRKIECNNLCFPVYFNPGERGWFLVETEDGPEFLHRIRTSVVKDVSYFENQIVVTTENSRYTFAKKYD